MRRRSKFFGKPAAQVTPYEAAMLAGLLRAPSVFNPMNDREAADERAQLVLQNMVAADFLNAEGSRRHRQRKAESPPACGQSATPASISPIG